MKKDDPVTLISCDGKEITISKKAAYLSRIIKNLCSIAIMEEAENNIIKCRNIDTKTLMNIAHLLEHTIKHPAPTIPSFAHIVAVTFLQKKSNSVTQSIINYILDRNRSKSHPKYYDLDHIKKYLVAVDFLDIPLLINALAKLLVSISNHTLINRIVTNNFFSPTIIRHIKKHIILHKYGLKELSIADYIKRTFPQKNKTDILKKLHSPRYSIKLFRKKITSLHGIAILSDKSVTSMNLGFNFISDPFNDPNCPVSPFHPFNCLKKLDLALCKLTEIPNNFFNGLSHLEILNISSNRIHYIHASAFNGLYALKRLDLFCNKLHTVDEYCFQKLSRLEILNLSLNEIKTVHHDAFKNLQQLIKLDLCCNKIKTIDEQTFLHLGNLTKLSLSCNKIATCTTNLFKGLYTLNKLDLSDNNMHQFDVEKIATELKNLTFLNLRKNHLNISSHVLKKMPYPVYIDPQKN